MNIVDVIRRETAGLEDRIAIREAERTITYGTLLQKADGVAGALRAAGLAPLDRVAFLGRDRIEYVIAALGILAADTVMVPISPSLSNGERQTTAQRMGVHAVLGETELCGSWIDGLPFAPEFLGANTFVFERREAAIRLPDEYAAMGPAFIRFSSGTTGTSKGVLLSHGAVEERTAAANRALRISPDDVIVWVLSMSYHFVVSILLFLRRGATIALANASFPESLLETVTDYPATFIYASPFHYHLLTSSEAVPRAALGRVRMAISTAMKLSGETARAFAEKFGFELTEAYGIIEVGLPCVNVHGAETHGGAVGQLLPDYSARIEAADAEGIGEIWLRGPGMFDAYVSPWQSRTTCLPDGWFRTGDLGRLDGEGRVYIAGRAKSVINFAGMKIFPYEVEEVLNRHPDVKESLVYGAAHPQYGQLPCARIVPADHAARALDTAALRRYCFRHLASFKVPKRFEPVEHLERTASGKLIRH